MEKIIKVSDKPFLLVVLFLAINLIAGCSVLDNHLSNKIKLIVKNQSGIIVEIPDALSPKTEQTLSGDTLIIKILTNKTNYFRVSDGLVEDIDAKYKVSMIQVVGGDYVKYYIKRKFRKEKDDITINDVSFIVIICDGSKYGMRKEKGTKNSFVLSLYP